MTSNRKYKELYKSLIAAHLTIGMVAISQAQVLEEIVVTAQKRAESLQDVPISVSALTGDSIENFKMDRAADIVSQVPNLQVSSPYGEVQPIFSIRGISMVDYNTNQASPIGVYVDEVAVGPSFMQGMQLFDLERVEVLRGPQGTLYGKNTTGGAINFITRGPTFERGGELTASAGNYGLRQLKGAGEIPLIDDRLGMRLAFTTTKADAFHDNHVPGKSDLSETDNYAFRFSTRYQTENFDGSLRLFKGESDPVSLAIVPIGTDPGGVNRLGYKRPDSFDSWEGEHNRPAPYKTDSKGGALTLNWDLGEYAITSITAYSDGSAENNTDTDGSPLRVLEIDFGSDSESFTQDLRLTSNFDGKFNFIAGLYYSNDELKANNLFDVLLGTEDFGIPFDPTLTTSGGFIGQSYTQERESYAIYTHSTYAFTENTSVTLGLRYTQDDGEFRDVTSYIGDYDRNPVYNLIPYLPVYDPAAAMQTKKYEDKEPTGKLGIDHRLGDDTLLYASYSRGYRSSAFNGGAIFSEDDANIADPEFVDAYEAGIKTQLWDNRLQINGAAFYYDYKDQQFINVIGINQTLENAGSSEIYGMEVEVQAAISERLSLRLGLGLVDTEFTDLVLNDPATNTPRDYSGNELQQAPKVNFNVALDYVIGQWSAGELALHVDTAYQDEQYFSAYNDAPGFENIRADSYWQTNALIRFDDSGERYSVSLWVKNVEENDEPIYALSLSSGYGYDYTVVGAPRQYGVDFTLRF
ncbi:MAG: TonB-dependent receptor [Halioglobus sp.]